MALELKDKAQKVGRDLEVHPSMIKRIADRTVLDDALSALLNLGYPAKTADRAVNKAISNIKDISLEGVIKEALRLMA